MLAMKTYRAGLPVLAVVAAFAAIPSIAQVKQPSESAILPIQKIAFEIRLGSGAGYSGSSSAAERSAPLLLNVNQPNIYVRDPLSGKPHFVAEGEYPTWSPDGSKLAYCARSGPSDSGRIHVINANGKGDRALTHLAGEGACYPAWSPSGKEMLVTLTKGVSSHIAVIDAQNGQVLRDLGDGGLAHWSPDGSQVLVERALGNLKVGGSLWVMSADGSGAKELLQDTSGVLESAWLPGGTGVVFSSRRDGMAALYTVGLDGKNIRKLGSSPTAHWLHPVFAPDGNTLVVESLTPQDLALQRISITAIDPHSHQAKILAIGSNPSIYWGQPRTPLTEAGPETTPR